MKRLVCNECQEVLAEHDDRYLNEWPLAAREHVDQVADEHLRRSSCSGKEGFDYFDYINE